MPIPTHLVLTLLLSVALFYAHPARSQIDPPNAAGVAMGHLHYHVRDLEANKAFWLALGGTQASFAAGEIIRFPGLLVILSAGEPDETRGDSLVDHIAFRVESLAALEDRFDLQTNEQFPGIAVAYSPEGHKVELFDDQIATNIGFDTDPDHTDPVAERHNEPLTGPIVSHHLHFYVPEDQVHAARDWYVEHFGATPGQRWRYEAADLPGINLNFSAADATRAPTQGGRLDHIGFEVNDLEAFCRELEASGVEFDQPFRRLPSGFAVAFLTDPWGTYIELSEGLRDFQ